MRRPFHFATYTAVLVHKRSFTNSGGIDAGSFLAIIVIFRENDHS